MDAEMGPANSLHPSAQYNEYNERFDFKLVSTVEALAAAWRTNQILILRKKLLEELVEWFYYHNPHRNCIKDNVAGLQTALLWKR